MHNPLLSDFTLPPFSEIDPAHVEPAIDQVLADNRAAIAALLADPIQQHPTWTSLLAPLEALEDRLERTWSPVSHLNAVLNSESLRAAHNACLPKLSDYASELGQNRALYEAVQRLADSDHYLQLEAAQRQIIDQALRDFRLAGVSLPPAQQQRFRQLQSELSQLTSRFSENLLDATNAWSLTFDSAAPLAGLPPSALAQAQQSATAAGESGWRITLQQPSYLAVMTYATDRTLRQQCYTAYLTRASDQGPDAGRWDNSEVMSAILQRRQQQAQLLGFANAAEHSLATKMAETPEQVIAFLSDLAQRSLPLAQRELAELATFAAESDGIDALQPWDVSYYSERLRQQRYELAQEALKPWFPLPQVLQGLFQIVQRLYGLTIAEQVAPYPSWHPSVRLYTIHDRDGEPRGRFYLDPYARPNKRGGAWMDSAASRRRRADGTLQQPIAYLVCNFTPPLGDDPALLTHTEVVTLFHEFGHGLHHLLTRIDYAGVSGINGVPWDAVELPSQFMENWCWEREALDLITAHYQSGEALPEILHQRLLASRQFQSGMQMVRQLEFALFDMRLHLAAEPADAAAIQQLLEQVRAEVAVLPPPPWVRFQHGFSHIFSGGYAAGYYSYKWAEVLSADAFSRFEEEGIFNRDTGLAFLEQILEQGGAVDPQQLFTAFRGREPRIDALLRHGGMI